MCYTQYSFLSNFSSQLRPPTIKAMSSDYQGNTRRSLFDARSADSCTLTLGPIRSPTLPHSTSTSRGSPTCFSAKGHSSRHNVHDSMHGSDLHRHDNWLPAPLFAPKNPPLHTYLTQQWSSKTLPLSPLTYPISQPSSGPLSSVIP